MKIVINTCFGGFGLSALAVKRIAELQGRSCYFFESKLGGKYEPKTFYSCSKSLFWTAFDIPNPEEMFDTGKKWHDMTMDERKEHNKLYDSHHIDSRYDDDKRDDPILVQVVEELGNEANGHFAELKIVEIPDDIKWVIDEYDGLECVEEAHRSWN